MRTSISTRSGTSSTMRSTASSPSPALADDLDVGLVLEHEPHAAPEQRVRVGEQDSNRRLGRKTSCTRRRNAQPLASMSPSSTVAPAVDHRGAAGVGDGEQEEVVAEQLHLERGLLDAHRLHVELLASSPRPTRRRRPRRRSSSSASSRPSGDAAAAAAPRALRARDAVAAPDPALVQPPHLLLDLVERAIERDHVLGGRRGALHEMLAHVHEDLARVRVSARRVGCCS